MTEENGWAEEELSRSIGPEAAGPPLPDGLFERARQALVRYKFSGPGIAVGHFDPQTLLLGRVTALEFKALEFRFLNDVEMRGVREEADGLPTLFAFRYDTLAGHIEKGSEWFLLGKEHATGEVRFTIQDRWRLGDFPNWWSYLGFQLIGRRHRSR